MRRRDLLKRAEAFAATMPEADRAALKADLEAAGPEAVANNLGAVKAVFPGSAAIHRAVVRVLRCRRS